MHGFIAHLNIADPLTPAGLSVTTTTTSLALTWDADAQSRISGWRVYHREQGTDTWTPQDTTASDGPQATITRTSADAGKIYEVKVRALASSGSSDVDSDDSQIVRATLGTCPELRLSIDSLSMRQT